MTDNCPKLFAIEAKALLLNNVLDLAPKTIFSFGFGFTGSTLVGTNVKEMLSIFVGNLKEIEFYDCPKYDFEKKLPSLDEIATLTKKIAEKYIAYLAVCFPGNIGCEFLIFAFCPKQKAYKVLKLFNTYQNPLVVEIEESKVSDGNYLILGDRKEEITQLISAKREKFDKNSRNWWRAPFIVLSNIIRSEQMSTIGGYLQFCMATPVGCRMFYMSSDYELETSLIGFDLNEVRSLGGFWINIFAGIVLPSENGW